MLESHIQWPFVNCYRLLLKARLIVEERISNDKAIVAFALFVIL